MSTFESTMDKYLEDSRLDCSDFHTQKKSSRIIFKVEIALYEVNSERKNLITKMDDINFIKKFHFQARL